MSYLKYISHNMSRLAIALSLSLALGACENDSKRQPAGTPDRSQALGIGRQTQGSPSSLSGVSTRKGVAIENLRVAFAKAKGAEKLLALQMLWAEAADSVFTDEVLTTLTNATNDADPRVAREAQIALNDLTSLRGMQDRDGSSAVGPHMAAGEPVSAGLPPADGADVVAGDAKSANSQNISDELRERALFDRDHKKRRAALGNVALRRSTDATKVLVEAVRDDNPGNRRRALKGLWYAAADGMDQDGQAWLALEAAVNDPDPEIAALARQALDDLNHVAAVEAAPKQVSEFDPVLLNNELSDVAPVVPDPPDIPQTLRDKALYGGDPGQRRAALQKVTLHRSDSATEILVATAQDDDPRNRRKALESLWFAAADGVDAHGQAQSALEAALSDSDSGIAALAQRALADLARVQTAKDSYNGPVSGGESVSPPHQQ